jgi:hypothetical protein
MDRESEGKTKPWRRDMLTVLLLVAGYFLLTWVILPRLGVPT